MDIKQAIAFVKQGRKVEAQDILADLIHANPHDITAWFWYVETLDSIEERVKVLNSCLQDNPENPQVIKALDMLKVKLPQQSKVPEPYSHENNFEAMPYETEQSKTSLPNIEIPENMALLRYLKDRQNGEPLISPYVNVITSNSYPGLVDSVGAFERDTERFPQNSKYLVYGSPVLLHPRTNIIICAVVIAGTVDYYYRVPQKNIQEMLSKKIIRDYQISKTLGKEWVSLYSKKESFIQKLYAFYGNTSGRAGALQIDYEEDFVKPPPELLKRFVEGVLTILLLVGFLFITSELKNPDSKIWEFLKGLFS
jgi:hypothetical protein